MPRTGTKESSVTFLGGFYQVLDFVSVKLSRPLVFVSSLVVGSCSFRSSANRIVVPQFEPLPSSCVSSPFIIVVQCYRSSERTVVGAEVGSSHLLTLHHSPLAAPPTPNSHDILKKQQRNSSRTLHQPKQCNSTNHHVPCLKTGL